MYRTNYMTISIRYELWIYQYIDNPLITRAEQALKLYRAYSDGVTVTTSPRRTSINVEVYDHMSSKITNKLLN